MIEPYTIKDTGVVKLRANVLNIVRMFNFDDDGFEQAIDWLKEVDYALEQKGEAP